MDSLIRETQSSGRVLGVVVNNKGKSLNFRARKAVILATGGSTGNVNFRRIFDPRLTEEYCGVAGEPHSFQDASGEIAAMAVGASLWGAYNQVGEFGFNHHQAGVGRMPLRVSQSEVAARKRVFQGGRCLRSNRFRLAGFDPGEPSRPALLRRDRRSIQLQSKRRRATVRAGRIPQPPERQDGPSFGGLSGCRDGGNRRAGQRRRTDMGDLRCRCRQARKMEPKTARRGFRQRILLRSQYDRGTCRQGHDEVPGETASRRCSRRTPSTATTLLSMPAGTRISTNRNPSTKFKLHPSMLPGQLRWCTTPAPGCASTGSARWWICMGK